jgi:hypothetical protein
MGTQTPKATGAEPQYSQETMNVGHETTGETIELGVLNMNGVWDYKYIYIYMYMYIMYMCIYVCIYVYMIIHIYRLTQTQ